MPRQRLTLPRIAAFNPKGESFLWDEDMPRLAVRARASGAKSFVFKGSLNYKDIRITIGSTDAWTIEAAREAARSYQRMIEAGRDPREVLKAQSDTRLAEDAARRVAEEAARIDAERKAAPALEAWVAYLEVRRPKWGELTIRDHERVSKEGGTKIRRGRKTNKEGTTQPGALRSLLARPLSEIDALAVEAWLKAEVAKRPTHAALAFRLLRGFLNWCAERSEYADQVRPNACTAKVVREELPKRAAKDDCLQREQLRGWFEKVRAIPNPVIAAYLQAALLTGPRREELAGLSWADVDFAWNTLTLRDKVEGERTIPLTPYVAALLRGLKARNETPPQGPKTLTRKARQAREEWKPSKWVFSSPTAESGRLQEPRIQHAKACAEAGIEGLTIHGLRRSFGTLAEWVECPVGVVAQIQGHKPSATAEKHYRRRPIDLLRQWHTKIEGWILAEAGIAQPEEGQKAALIAV